MKKLPKEIDPQQVNNSTYLYRDAMEMIEDMRRLRRRTGWFATWIETSDRYIFHLTEPAPEPNPEESFEEALDRSRVEKFAQFEVKV